MRCNTLLILTESSQTTPGFKFNLLFFTSKCCGSLQLHNNIKHMGERNILYTVKLPPWLQKDSFWLCLLDYHKHETEMGITILLV